jgi:hypothetical protein
MSVIASTVCMLIMYVVFLCMLYFIKQGKRDPLHATTDNIHEGGESTIECAMSTLYTVTGVTVEADQLQPLEDTATASPHQHGTQLFAYYV